MVYLRHGLDKIMFTIRDKSVREYKYPKDVAMMYDDRLAKLKFSDRFAQVIHFSKYPHFSWKYQGETKSTYAVEYFLRLDGMRQMRVFVNCQRLYNVENGLPLYDKRLFDDNVIIPSHIYSMEEFVDLVQWQLPILKGDYIKIRKEVFGDELLFHDIIVDTHQVEVVTEGIGLHTSDVSSTFQDFARCDSFKVYHNQTNTHYLNTTGHRQLKIYQKGIGILRLEATFNVRPGDIVFNWIEPQEVVVRQIEAEMEDLYDDMNIPMKWYDCLKINKDKLIWIIANALNLREKGKKDGAVQSDLMKVLLTIRSWNSNKNLSELTRRLVRKKLLRPIGKARYVPTENLRLIQELFNKLETVEGIYENFGEV